MSAAPPLKPTEIVEEDVRQYAASILVDYAERYKKSGGLRSPIDDLPNILFSYNNIKFESYEIEGATEILVELGVGEYIHSGHSRSFFLIESDQFSQSSRMDGWKGADVIYLVDQNYPILSAFRKLGSSWLSENLRIAFKDRIDAHDAEQSRIMTVLLKSSYQPKDFVPAADRVVSLDHNEPEYIKIAEGILEVRKQIDVTNEFLGSDFERSRLLAALSAAHALWKAQELKILQIKVGILMAVEDAAEALTKLEKGIAVALLVDAVKAFVKSRTGIDLDKI